MNKLETIWDFNKSQWDSSVQVFGDECFKLYPQCHLNPHRLEVYHKYQWSLWSFSFPVDIPSLQQLGYKTINIRFLDLSNTEILYGSDIYSRTWLLITNVPFEDWKVLVWEELYSDIFADVINYFEFHGNTSLHFLAHSLYKQNVKLVTSEEGVLELVCTDVFGNIPTMVNDLLLASPWE